MYVRIISGKKREGKAHDCFYECKRVALRPVLVEPEEGKFKVKENFTSVVLDEEEGNTFAIECEHKDLQIYIMNKEGKTIERHVW